MGKLEVLMATMNANDLSFLDSMNIQSDIVIINQNDSVEDIKKELRNGHAVKWISTLEKGLSRSRNLAIKHSSADYCLIADDDMHFVDNYEKIIVEAYNKYPEADIIAFQVKRIGNSERSKQYRNKPSWDNYLTSMKISSVEITFKRESIIENNIQFNPYIGAGTQFYNGEENVFLYESLKKGLKVLYLPIQIGSVDTSESSWYEGYTEQYWHTAGAKFYNMSNKYYHLLIAQFALRKYPLYKKKWSFFQAVKKMYEGKTKYTKLYETNYED